MAPDDEYYNDDDSEELDNEKIDPLAIEKVLAKNAVSWACLWWCDLSKLLNF